MAQTSSVFLSHALADRRLADAIGRALERVSFSVWSDKLVPVGADWDATVEQALERSDAVVLLVSPAFLESSHSLFEAGLAIHRSRRGGGRLVPVLVGDLDVEVVPLPLKDIQVLDGRGLGEAEIADRVATALT